MALTFNEVGSSSPPRSSSPIECYSSASSPAPETPFAEDLDRVLDPFAAAVKATKPPRDYEKKQPIIPPPNDADQHKDKRFRLAEPKPEQIPSGSWKIDQNDDEEAWSKAVDIVLTEANGTIDLTHQGLTHISRKALSDLGAFYVPSEAQENEQLPSLSPSTHQYVIKPKHERRFHRTQSTTGWSNARHEVQLYLKYNSIRWLPPELFDLKKLTVLSLVNNGLTFIPPEIEQLTALTALNIMTNEIRFLPSEIMKLSLTSLLVTGNPFIPQETGVRRVTSHFTDTIPLFELCLRVLFQQRDDGKTNMETYYEPLPEGYAPPNIEVILRKCDRTCIFHDPKTLLPPNPRFFGGEHSDYNEVTGISTCASPVCARRFVMHAEEMYTWEKRVAGCELLETVPIRWRGCNHGCLGFLATDSPEPAGEENAKDVEEEEEAFESLDLGNGLSFD